MKFFRSILLLVCFCQVVFAQQYQGKTLVEPSLLVDTNAVQAGKEFRLGILLKMAPGWHTYWKYPGDSGIQTKIEWQLPPGFKIGKLEWPTPEVENEEGDLQVYVYTGEVLLFTTVTPPKQLPQGNVEIGAKVGWLVCEKLCIPGKADLKLTLPTGVSAPGDAIDTFQKYESRLPQPALPFSIEWTAQGRDLVLSIPEWTAGEEKVFFYPNPPDGVLLGHPRIEVSGNLLKVRISLLEGSKPVDRLAGVLQAGQQSWEIGAPPPASPSGRNTSPPSSSLTLLPALLFAFLGGLILNFMPCVLPVISLKMFSFVKQAGESRPRIFRLGLAFAGGMFTWFLGLALVLLLIRSTGREISWAQQFQNPWFNMGISVLIFVFALNLLGVFEITLPGAATTKLAATGDGGGMPGAFFQGMFATILGTPCTAPYLGTTLAFALAQPPVTLLAIFATIAFGMSAPYLVLCANPGWMRFLPRPGIWMVRLKEFMGFLLLATLLWFVWIVGRQLGINAIVFLGSLLLLCGVGAWLYGNFLTPVSSSGNRKIGAIGMIAVLGAITALLLYSRPTSEIKSAESFPIQLERALATDRIVFVDFTADWCLSCKVNKRVAIDSASVQAAFAKKNVLFLEADWTNGDPAITKILKQNGRAGVPLYLIYPANRSNRAIVLPELLTPGLILEALDRV